MFQVCRKCGRELPLSNFSRRPDSNAGIRRTCKECRKSAKNAANQRWYHAHQKREQAKQRLRRANDLEKFRLSDARYRLRNREVLNAKCRAYYRKHRDRLIQASIAYRKRYRSLDFGWQHDLRHDVAQYRIWQEQQQQASTLHLIANLLDSLTAEERDCCELFMKNSTPIPPKVLISIRSKATSILL